MTDIDDKIAAWRARIDRDRTVARRADPGPWTTRNLGRHDMSSLLIDTGARIAGTDLPAGPAIARFDGSRAAANALHAARMDPAETLRRCDELEELLDLLAAARAEA